MRDFGWENSLEEMCDSPEQVERLKETASLFDLLSGTRCSPSFQQELRQSLLEQARAQDNTRGRGLFSPWGRKIWAGRTWWRSPAPVMAAAVLIFVLALSALNNYALRSGDPAASGEQEGQAESFLLGDAGSSLAEEKYILEGDASGPIAELEAGGQNGQNVEQRVKEGGSDKKVEVAASVGEGGKISGEGSPATGGKPADPPGEVDSASSLPDEPAFEVHRNSRKFTLAGNILLHYGSATGVLYPVENVEIRWEPNKIVPASASEAWRFGTEEWARQLLSDEGFRVREGETVEVKVYKTTQGLYAELFYRASPALVLHVHEEKGILAYYYEEKTNLAPTGYYPLLAPQLALQQLQALSTPIEGQQLRFSFREVRLTYNDFLVEKGGIKQHLRLPAWCFTGSELHQRKEGVDFYLVAVRIE